MRSYLNVQKATVSEHLWTVKIFKGLNQCLNLHGSICVIFFDYSERKSAHKNSFLEVSEILRLFVSILTADNKYILSVKAIV